MATAPQQHQAGSAEGVLDAISDADEDDEGVIRTGAGSPFQGSRRGMSQSRPGADGMGRGSGGGRQLKSQTGGFSREGTGASVQAQQPALEPEVQAFLQQHRIQIEHSGAQGVPTPVLTMDQAPFHPSIMASVSSSKFQLACFFSLEISP